MTDYVVDLRVECDACESAWHQSVRVRCRSKARAEKAAELRLARELGGDYVCFSSIQAEWVRW